MLNLEANVDKTNMYIIVSEEREKIWKMFRWDPKNMIESILVTVNWINNIIRSM
jgi:hypothetical protein